MLEKKPADPAPSIAVPGLGVLEGSISIPTTWLYVICIAIAILFFIVDVMLPRGASAAIGYCLVPVLAAGASRHGFLLLMTLVCTALTAIGYYFESPGAPWWMSLFDRAMVLGVLWLTFLLSSRRAAT